MLSHSDCFMNGNSLHHPAQKVAVLNTGPTWLATETPGKTINCNLTKLWVGMAAGFDKKKEKKWLEAVRGSF